MVSARSRAWIPHAILIAGIAIVLFPVYVALVASTLDLPSILTPPMPLLPGSHLIGNFTDAMTAGTAKTSGVSVARMMFNSLVMALIIAVGKIAISLPSAYGVVLFGFRLQKLCF